MQCLLARNFMYGVSKFKEYVYQKFIEKYFYFVLSIKNPKDDFHISTIFSFEFEHFVRLPYPSKFLWSGSLVFFTEQMFPPVFLSK